MPFGTKLDVNGQSIHFDEIYRLLILPAIEGAELEPLRADEEMAGGIIHKPMFERLVLCDYAVADLTTSNANVFYELGIRHAVRPWSTVLVFAEGNRLPFDVAPLRGVPYGIDPGGHPSKIEGDVTKIRDRLLEAKKNATQDSPLFELLDNMQPPDVSHIKTDVFRERVEYSTHIKEQLTEARRKGREAVHAIELSLGEISQAEAAVVVDLFLSYRAIEAWADMVALVPKMARPLAGTVLVQEQVALALNRMGQGDRAEETLHNLLLRRGPSSESYGILGRIYKDRWQQAIEHGQTALAGGLLNKAIDAYYAGFESDVRDAYPGINAATLMEISDPPDPRRGELLPVVKYAAERRVRSACAGYWDHAVLLEVAVLVADAKSARHHLSAALAGVHEAWEPKTTARNLSLIRIARERRGEPQPWIGDIERELVQSAGARN
jgi:hypothetical protein